MKSYKTFISEMKKAVASWQAGVRASQTSAIPSSEQFKDSDFQAGWKTGLEKGSKAEHPSYRAGRVKKQKSNTHG